jgi:hypothetical protein
LAVASTQSGMFVSEHKLRPHLARSSLMLVAAVAVSPLFMAQIAAASCGDYVTVAGNGDQGSGHSLPGVPGCSGPNCQRQVPPPALPTKASLTFQHSDSAYWAQPDGTSSPPLAHAALDHDLTLSEGHLLRLLRPPRV